MRKQFVKPPIFVENTFSVQDINNTFWPILTGNERSMNRNALTLKPHRARQGFTFDFFLPKRNDILHNYDILRHLLLLDCN